MSKASRERERIRNASKAAVDELQFWCNIAKTHDVEFHPIEEDLFGDGIPRMITVITKR